MSEAVPATSSPSNINEQKGTNEETRKPIYYKEELEVNLEDDMRNILRKYSGLSKDELVPHLYATRDKAWAAAPWPCIGQWSFLKLRLRSHPAHDRIVDEAKSAKPGTYLFCDVGTGMGQELRGLAAAGVPIACLRAIDQNDLLWNCGFELFRDKDKMKDAAFATANILDISNEPIASWKGTLDAMLIGLFLHCFDWEGQLIAAKNLAVLLKKKKGALIVGWQLGGPAVHVSTPSNDDKQMFLHNEESFQKLWNLVGEQTGDQWTVWAKQKRVPELESGPRSGWMPKFTTLLVFTVSRKPSK